MRRIPSANKFTWAWSTLMMPMVVTSSMDALWAWGIKEKEAQWVGADKDQENPKLQEQWFMNWVTILIANMCFAAVPKTISEKTIPTRMEKFGFGD